jgi:hypothetical protein
MFDVLFISGKTKYGGHLSKWIFDEGSFNQKPLALGRSERQFVGILSWSYLLRMSKIMKNIMSLFGETENCGTGSHKVAHHFSAHSRLAKPPSIAIWGKIFCLAVFSVLPLLDPYWTYGSLGSLWGALPCDPGSVGSLGSQADPPMGSLVLWMPGFPWGAMGPRVQQGSNRGPIRIQ